MLTIFKFFNLDSFYFPWVFQTPATPIAHGILVFHHELMVLLTFICFFVLWMLVRTIQLHCSPNDLILVLTRGAYSFAHYKHKGVVLEIVWTLVPALLLLFFTKHLLPMRYKKYVRLAPSTQVWGYLQKRRFCNHPPKKDANSASDSLPKSLMTKTRAIINTGILAFIKNEKKQQEIFLAAYLIALLIVAHSFFRSDALCLAFCFIGSLFIFLAIVKLMRTGYRRLKYNSLYSKSIAGAFILFSLYLEQYRVLIFIALYTMVILAKTRYTVTHGTRTYLGRFFNDLITIEEHFKNDFPLFNAIRYHNVLLAACFSCGFFVLSNGLLPTKFFISPIVFGVILEVMFFVFISNFFLIIVIQLLITFFCNMPVALKVAQVCLACGTIGVGRSIVFLGFHVTSTTPMFEPIDLPIVHDYQKSTMGFASRYGGGVLLGKQYKLAFQENPPVDTDGFIDKTKATKALETFLDEKLNSKTETAIRGAIWGLVPFRK